MVLVLVMRVLRRLITVAYADRWALLPTGKPFTKNGLPLLEVLVYRYDYYYDNDDDYYHYDNDIYNVGDLTEGEHHARGVFCYNYSIVF